MRGRAAFLILLFLLPAPAWAADECPAYTPPVIEVRPFVSAPRFDVSQSLPQIQAMAARDSEQFAGSRHEIPVGLTAAKLQLDSRFEVMTQTRTTDGTTCAQISHFILTLGFDNTIVYLAHELPIGSCGYQVVMGHEMRHVGVDQELINSLVPILPNMLRLSLDRVGTVRAPSPQNAQDELRHLIDAYMTDLGKNIAELRQRHQEPVDSQDEYTRLSRSCNGELGRITAPYMR